MKQPFEFCDSLGPEKIIHINNSASSLKAIVVVDNTACGPAIGGCRMAPDVSLEECVRLARAMTLKNASAGLPHGGAKSVVFADPTMDRKHKETLMREFAHAIKMIEDYIVGPDMGTNEHFMACIHDEIQRAVGLPRVFGGIPLDEIGATGWGVCNAAKAAQQAAGIKLEGSTFAIQGFGAVGYHAARFLAKEGAIMVAASDSKGCIVNENGIDVAALYKHKQDCGSLNEFSEGDTQTRDAVVDVPCDIWIPAARPDIITMDNVERLNTKIVVQGANIPIHLEAEQYLHKNGVVSIPDYIANSGGVICAAVEYRKGSEVEAMQIIQDKITANTETVLKRSMADNITPRAAADKIAVERVQHAERLRRFKG